MIGFFVHVFDCKASGYSVKYVIWYISKKSLRIPHTINEYTITLQPGGGQFVSQPGRSLLQSGLAAGSALPYGCANGSCGDCRARIVSGETQRLTHFDYPLTEAEKLEGVCLMCSVEALSDLVIEVREASSAADLPLQQLSAKVCRLEPLPQVLIVAFKFTRGKALRFLPGQLATLTFPNDTTYCVPIASCPCDAGFIELHLPLNLPPNQPMDLNGQKDLNGQIRHNGENPLATMAKSLNSRERVAVCAPSGSFTLSRQTNETAHQRSGAGNAPGLQRHIFMVAIGIGFARLQGLIEQLFNLQVEDTCCLVWIKDDQVGHYRHNLCRSWDDAFDEFTYRPVDNIQAAIACIKEQWPNEPDNTEVYLSEAEPDIQRFLTNQGVAPENLFVAPSIASQSS